MARDIFNNFIQTLCIRKENHIKKGHKKNNKSDYTKLYGPAVGGDEADAQSLEKSHKIWMYSESLCLPFPLFLCSLSFGHFIRTSRPVYPSDVK